MPDSTAARIDEMLGKPAVDPKAKERQDDYDFTEDGVAQLFAKRHAGDLRFDTHAQAWRVWDTSRWRPEETRLAFEFARRVSRDVGLAAPAGSRPKMARANFASAVERFAQADRAFAATADTWDRDPWLLATPGGTVQLRTGELQPARRANFITRQTLVAPAPAGTAHPVWSRFLHQATGGDADLQRFLQRLAGYAISGDVTEEALAFLYGEGGTGKGTFISALTAILGDYAISVPIEVFTAGSRLNLEYYRALMAGARLVTASETEAGATWAESQIKELTGNEAPLSARHPFGRPFSFRPQFKIALVGNHAPRLKVRSDAMERRLRIAPFRHKPAAPDHGLKERLREEYPAILRWMIDGCLIWQRERLGTCEAIRAETGTYFEQQDAFGRWIEERCILDKTLESRPGTLQADFNTWAKANGEDLLRPNEFAELLDRRPGLRRDRSNGVRRVRGIGLQADPDSGRAGW